MDSLYKEYVISFFDKEFQMHGDRPEGVRWTPKGQSLRYECLLDIDESIEGSKVLDYGCGKGDLYQVLKDRNISVNYTGFDINANLISLAKQKHPETVFRVFDIEIDNMDEEFDYIFLCGVFNLKLKDLDKTVKNVLKRLFLCCRKALAFNALSSENPKKSVELNYLSQDEMIDFARTNLSPHVSLAKEKIPYDFTMFVRKEEQGAAGLTSRQSL
ncbi:MAG TPA: class I SAM-dependent methyltransferase [Nitrospirae bacterium]|nr:trans-aconitate 2-methyltransferase [bacterium BMS3Bbin09]HDH33843.1 class I SAM-dependent methyltransferase [Nitrospirota bacterium]HDO66986.1 class I SAM-dependent methyltransferase [Nitrospirota bacterium]HEW81160.1 class I SAM-dependent methyltransferase [Nitrospirota bacterium]